MGRGGKPINKLVGGRGEKVKKRGGEEEERAPWTRDSLCSFCRLHHPNNRRLRSYFAEKEGNKRALRAQGSRTMLACSEGGDKVRKWPGGGRIIGGACQGAGEPNTIFYGQDKKGNHCNRELIGATGKHKREPEKTKGRTP